MSELKAISLVMIFITVVGLFIFASNQIMPTYLSSNATLNNSMTVGYDKPPAFWDPLGFINPFTYIHYFYDIMTFEIFGLPDDLQTLLQRVVYIPISIITILCVLYFIRGN